MSAPPGQVYLLCFARPIGDTDNPKGAASHHLAEHRAARGARIRAACVTQGIAFEVVRTWADVDRSFEHRLKRQHNAWRHRPRCRCRALAGPAAEHPVASRAADSQ